MKKHQVEEAIEEGYSDLQENISKIADKAKPFAEKVIKTSQDLYSEALDHLPAGSNKVIGYAAAGLALGVVAYQLGKSSRRPPLLERTTEASGKLNEQLAPAFKFLKMWMLYRMSI
jgi:hypothetical protein